MQLFPSYSRDMDRKIQTDFVGQLDVKPGPVFTGPYFKKEFIGTNGLLVYHSWLPTRKVQILIFKNQRTWMSQEKNC
jgi:hypothetical protein